MLNTDLDQKTEWGEKTIVGEGGVSIHKKGTGETEQGWEWRGAISSEGIHGNDRHI